MENRERMKLAEAVIAAAREFRDNGTVLTVCGRGPCQRVIEAKDNSDPQAKLFAALAAYDKAPKNAIEDLERKVEAFAKSVRHR